MRTINFSKKKNIHFILIICGLMTCFLLFINEFWVKDQEDVLSDFLTQTQDQAISISWNIPQNSKIDFVHIDISNQEGETIDSLDIAAHESPYIYSGGEHGQLYTFNAYAHKSNGSIGDTFSSTSMYIDYSEMPQIPMLIINTETGTAPTYEIASRPNDWALGETLTKNDYVSASITDLKQEIPLGDTPVRIRVRGNTSSVLYDKKAYKLAFDSPVDLLGLGEDYSVTEWALLANGDNIRNFLGYKVSELCGLEWQLHMRYVNLIMNGDYLGTYILTESVNQESSHGLVSDSGYIFENDMYWWNSNNMYFRTTNQNQIVGYTIKYPKMYYKTDYRFQRLHEYMEEFDNVLFSNDNRFKEYIDTDNWISWIMARDYLENGDGGGANIYLYKYDYNPNNPFSSKIKMGPLWDFDMIFENYNDWSASRDEDVYFFAKLFEQDDFNQAYINKWLEKRDILYPELEKAINSLIDSQGDDLNESWRIDSIRWNLKFQTIEERKVGALDSFKGRTDWINNQLGVN